MPTLNAPASPSGSDPPIPARIRAFIAVELDDAVKERLEDAVRRLRASDADVKWVRPGAMHLTLKFVGEVAPERIEALKTLLPPALKGQSRFSVAIRGLGTFPEKGRAPRVVWAGMEGPVDRLVELARIAEDAAGRVGVAREDRPFSAHVTLGRMKSPRNAGRLMESIERERALDFGRQEVTAVTLVQSRLLPAGPVYAPLLTVNL